MYRKGQTVVLRSSKIGKIIDNRTSFYKILLENNQMIFISPIDIICSFIDNYDAQRLRQAAGRYVTDAESAYSQDRLMYEEDYKKKHGKSCFSGIAPGFSARAMTFEVTRGESSSKSIRRFLEGETVCECHSLCMAVFYRAILEILGDKLFDLIFSGLKIEGGAFWETTRNPLKKIIDQVKIQEENQIIVGDWIYARNVPEYKKKHPTGVAAGWNLVCVGVEPHKYIGLGLTKKAESKTLSEVLDILQDAYNASPITMSEKDKKTLTSASVEDRMIRVGSGHEKEPFLDKKFPARRLNISKLEQYARQVLQSHHVADD